MSSISNGNPIHAEFTSTLNRIMSNTEDYEKEDKMMALEENKFELEKQKLSLEENKIQLERDRFISSEANILFLFLNKF